MADRNVTLLVAAYGDDTAAAAEDFQTIKGLDDTLVVAAVVLERDSAGKVDVKEHGGGLVGGGTARGRLGGWWSGCSPRRCCWRARSAQASGPGSEPSRSVTRRRRSGSTRRTGSRGLLGHRRGGR